MSKGAYIGVPRFAKRNLPSGYAQVEYIESTGTQYFDTGFKPNQNTRVVLSAYNNSASSGWTFGTWDSSSQNQFAFSCNASYSFRYGATNVSLSAVPIGAVKAELNKNAYNLNGTAGTMAEQTFSCSYTMYLFAINAAGSVSGGKFTGRLYSCKIYDNGNLIRDYVPCKNASGAAGLYDMVNATFSAGEGGAFVAGADIVEEVSVARKVKKGYIGVPTKFPVYEESSTTITENNVAEFFDVVDGEHGFVGSGGVFSSATNTGSANRISESTWTAKKDIAALSLDYYVGKPVFSNPTFRITVAGEVVVESTTTAATGSWSGEIKAGESIVFYTSVKDPASTFSNVVAVSQVQTGTETKGIARKIKKAYIGVDGIAKLCWAGGTPIGELAVGKSVYLNVSGTPKEFLVVHQGNPDASVYDASCDGTWLLMKEVYETRKWSSVLYPYPQSSINTYLTGTFLGLFDEKTQAAMRTAKIPYLTSAGSSGLSQGANGYATKVFLLSATEVGFTKSDNQYIATEGAKLSYFSNDASRVAYMGGDKQGWWTRSLSTSSYPGPWAVWSDGGEDVDGIAAVKGLRPAVIMPPETLVDDNGNIIF